MKLRQGFSLIEISMVIFIMGLTITALLQMFEWSHMRYRAISSGWQQRVGFAEIRVWLREQISAASPEKLDAAAINKAIKLPDHYFVNGLKVTRHDDETWFVQLELCEDRNHNGQAESSETLNRLFCFRRRSV